MASYPEFENHRFRALIWIVRKLERKPMSLSELNKEWKADIDISRGMTIERRTFSNYLRAIWDMFRINIECNRRDGYRYRITTSEIDPVVSHIINNFEQNLALGKAVAMSKRIIVDKAPMGTEYLERIMDAIEQSRLITFEFRNFNSGTTFTVTGAPYCVKLYQQRWYVVVHDEDEEIEDDIIDTYSLDRITSLKIEDRTFLMPDHFDADHFFRYSFGVRVNHEEEPVLIKLKVKSVQREYFRTLPLHHSQQETETCDDYSIFTIEIVPTVEFIIKVLSYGSLVEVLSPQDYRDVLKEEVELLYRTYF